MNLAAILTAVDVAAIVDWLAKSKALSTPSIFTQSLLAEREVLLNLLEEVEPHWDEYSNMGYCVECCRITDAAGYYKDNPSAKFMPHEDGCVHLLIDLALNRAGR